MTPERVSKAQEDFNAAFDEQDDVEAEREVDDMRAQAADDEFMKVAERAKEPITAEPKSFKDAFAKARTDGLKVFDWNGKQYTTQMKGTQNPASANPAKPAAPAASVESVVKVKKPAPVKRGLTLQDVPADNTMYSEGKSSMLPKEEPKKMSWMDVKPLRAADDAKSIYRRNEPEKRPMPDLSPVGKVAMKG